MIGDKIVKVKSNTSAKLLKDASGCLLNVWNWGGQLFA